MIPIDSDHTTCKERELLEIEVDAIFGLNYTHSPPTLHLSDLDAVCMVSSQASFIALAAAVPVNIKANFRLPNGIVRPDEVRLYLERLSGAIHLSLGKISGGPTFLFPESFFSTPSAILSMSFQIIDSTSSKDIQLAQLLRRPPNWEPDEWYDLTRATSGPWAMAIQQDGEGGDNVCDAVSVCFSARRTRRAAEAGVWTREGFRGRGLAPAVVAAWAKAEYHDASHNDNRENFTIFYSTSSENFASQAVANRLGLKPLGWIWKLFKPSTSRQA